MYLPMYHPVSVKKFQSHGKLSCQKSAREGTLRTVKTLTKESEREQKRENKKKEKLAPTGNIILFKVLYTSLLTPMYYMTKQNHSNKGGGGRNAFEPFLSGLVPSNSPKANGCSKCPPNQRALLGTHSAFPCRQNGI